MSWVKVDDKAPRHKKQLKAGAEACWLWVCGLAYAKEQPEHDGRIPSEAVGILYPLKNHAALAARLVKVGLWEETEDGYQIHDWSYWNGTAEEVEEKKQRARERAAASYEKKRQSAPQTRTPSAPILQRRESAEPEQSAPPLRGVCDDSSGSNPSPIPSPIPDPSQAPDPERAGLTAGAYRQTDETAEQLSATLMVPLDELREVEGLVIARLLASGAQVKGPARRYAQTALLEALRDPKRRSEARQTIAARREEAAREESRSRSDAEALERIAADKREADRRAALTPDQREVEDALRTLERSDYTLAHPGLPLSATAPARAAKRKAEATLAKHGVPVPEGAKRSA